MLVSWTVGEDGALDELEQHQPLLLAILDMVLANEGGRQSSQNRTKILPGPRRAQVVQFYFGIIVCPLTVNAGSGSQLGSPNRGIPWRRWGASCDGLIVQFQLLYVGWWHQAACHSALQALHLWKFLNDFGVLDDGATLVHSASLVGVPQRADGEVILRHDQTHHCITKANRE